MQRLTPIEWARAKEPITHLSLSSRGHDGRERMIGWLVARTGASWFYVHGDNFHFGSPMDAADPPPLFIARIGRGPDHRVPFYRRPLRQFVLGPVG